MATTKDSNNSLEAPNNNQLIDQPRSIFRLEAQQHYLANQQRIVFPRLLSGKFFTVLWFIALTLYILGAIVTFWPLVESLLWG